MLVVVASGLVILSWMSDVVAGERNDKLARLNEARLGNVVLGAQAAIIDPAIKSIPLCHFNAAPGGIENGDIIVYSYGTTAGNLIVVPEPGAPWLSIPGGPNFVANPSPAPTLLIPLVMDATGLSEGVYSATIRIDHDAINRPSPIYLHLEFRVDADYMCADSLTLRTATGSPDVLSLTVGSNGRHGMSNYAGLYRVADGSNSLYDGTLIIAHGPQATDTTVYYDIYGGTMYGDDGARGFIAKTPLSVDSSASGSGSGNVIASYTMRTKDEVLGIDVEWYFPQNPDSADFIIAKYTLENLTGSTVTDILVGQLNDFDVVPGTLFQSYQSATRNHGYYVAAENLIYQYGWTTPGMATNPPLGLAERYSAGVVYLSGRDYASGGAQFTNSQVALRGGTADLDDFFFPYFSDTASEYLYPLFNGPIGVNIYEGYPDADSSSDLFTYMCLDQGLSLAPGATQSYVVGFVCDTLYNPGVPTKAVATTGLLETIAKAKEWAIDYNIVEGGSCACPNQGDIEPDGFLTALDLASCIDILFAGSPDIQDTGCPTPRFDIDCDGFSTALDLSKLIDHLFAGGAGPCDPCAP